MPSFNFVTLTDLLSWIAMLAVATKVAVTLFVLAVDRDMRDRPGWGSTLWWTTKITPFIAVGALMGIAVIQRDRDLILLYGAAALFVVIAVPWKVHERRKRIAAGTPPGG